MLVLMVQRDLSIEQMTNVLWQVGIMCTDAPMNVNCCHVFMDLHLIDKMFDYKLKLGAELWQ